MVNLAKIRKKAKSGGRRSSAAPAAEDGGAPPKTESNTAPSLTPQEKLERFVALAGQQRFVRQAVAETAGDEVELLTFLLGNERYAIEIDRIAQIIVTRPATAIPNAPADVTGIVSVRGSIVTLVDVRRKLRQPAPANGDAQLIVIRDEGGLVGFEVDRVLRPSKVARTAIEPQPVVSPAEEREAIRGVIRSEGSLTIVLDLVKLLN